MDRWDWVLDADSVPEKIKDEHIIEQMRVMADAQAAQSICPSCDAWATCPKGSVAQGIYKGEPIRECPWHPRGPPVTSSEANLANIRIAVMPPRSAFRNPFYR
jgi:hypothetical protein